MNDVIWLHNLMNNYNNHTHGYWYYDTEEHINSWINTGGVKSGAVNINNN